MVKVMAVNAGSSSLKFQLINMPSEEVITSGLVERIGQEVGNFVIKVNGEKIQTQTPIPDHQVAVDLLLNALVDHHIVESLEEIDAVGHRVVHGGEDFDDSVVVDEEAVKKVADLSELAPLHNPANIIGYKAFKEALPDHVGHVFVFDTAFHQTLDKERYLYPLPLEYYTDLKVRKYGAHGTLSLIHISYIRSLCVDIAKKLGYPGHMSHLERRQAGRFLITDCITLEQLENDDYSLHSIDDALCGFPQLKLDDPTPVYYGKQIKSDLTGQVAIYDNQNHLLAIYESTGQGYLKNVRGLW